MSRHGIASELHKPARRHFRRRHVITKGLYDLFQSDLMDMSSYAKQNRGFRYVLVLIDVYSKYAWLRPLKTKTGQEVTSQMKSILQELPTMPKNLQTDNGTEYYNKDFQALMKKNGINHYSVYSTMKACIAERLIRTLKNKLFTHFSAKGSYVWIDILQHIAHQYNNTVHSTIKDKPVNVVDNSLLSTVFTHANMLKRSPKFKVGDYVRISKHKAFFTKGYLPSWTTELFKVNKVQLTQPVTYLLKDLQGNVISGAFYTEELQKTKYPSIYLVERILKRQGNKVYVKWLGFNSDHNSWIASKDLVD